MLDIGFGAVEEIKKKIKEHGAIGHIISTRAEGSELMCHAVPSSLSPLLHNPGSPAQGMVPPTVGRFSHLN